MNKISARAERSHQHPRHSGPHALNRVHGAGHDVEDGGEHADELIHQIPHANDYFLKRYDDV